MADFSVTGERIDKYLGLTAKALDKVSIIGDPGTDSHNKAEDILSMVNAYYSDAKYFLSEGRGDDAFAAINYAHGWIDFVLILVYIDGKGDLKLFTISN